MKTNGKIEIRQQNDFCSENKEIREEMRENGIEIERNYKRMADFWKKHL